VTAFDVIGRALSGVRSVSVSTVNCSFARNVDELLQLGDGNKRVVRARRDVFSFTVNCTVPRNDLGIVRFEILPIDDELVIRTESRVMGAR
jgi:hypothetical protein